MIARIMNSQTKKVYHGLVPQLNTFHHTKTLGLQIYRKLVQNISGISESKIKGNLKSNICIVYNFTL